MAFAVAISVLSTRNHGGASSSWLGAVAALTFELTFELVTIMIVCNHTVHRRTDEIDRPDPLPRRSHMTDTATPTGTLSAAEADAFRTRCREFLGEHAKPGARRNLAAARRFQQALADAGLAGL